MDTEKINQTQKEIEMMSETLDELHKKLEKELKK
jgi:hypothetical protein